MVRGTVNLPHGTGKTARVAVFAVGEKADAAVAAGADVVGSDDLIEKIQGGWLEFDAAIATPDTDTDDGDEAWQPITGGVASWYGAKFAGHRTASGERFDPSDYTAAHRTLPFGTRVRVTDADGDSVIVRINDRGPFARGRVIDLSQAAAKELGLTRAGSGKVSLAVLDQ